MGKVPFYQCEETVFVGGNGHGDKSVFLLAQHIKLSIEEMAAINNHMGFTAGYEIAVGECYEHNTLAWILHVADEAAAYWWRT